MDIFWCHRLRISAPDQKDRRLNRTISFFKLLGSGKINRRFYVLGLLAVYAAVSLKLRMSAGFPISGVGLPGDTQMDPSALATVDFMTGVTLASHVLFLPMMSLTMVFLTAQRLRHLGISGWFSLLGIYPPAAILMVIPLMLLPGRREEALPAG